MRNYLRRSSYLPYPKTSWGLFAIAGVSLLYLIATNRSDILGATLLLIGASSLIMGILLLAFTQKEPIDSRVAEFLIVGMIESCKICRTLPIEGNALMAPTGRGLRLYVPLKKGVMPQNLPDTYSYRTDSNGGFVSYPPSSVRLQEWLRKEFSLTIPHDEKSLFIAIKESFEDALEIADEVTIRRMQDILSVDIHHYRFFDGCLALQQSSANCCVTAPCPACSLVASMLSEGMKKPLVIQQVVLDKGSRTIRITLIPRTI